MRVISGSLKGRIFSAPSGNRTHPMGDKVRGALFNTLGDVSGLNVLDAYSGSGAVGIEAVSRGANQVSSVEIDPKAFAIIKQNISKLDIDNINVSKANISTWLSNNLNTKFGLVIADPPYDSVRPKILEQIANAADKGAVVVFSLPESEIFTLPKVDFEPLASKKYANATLVFYRKLK